MSRRTKFMSLSLVSFAALIVSLSLFPVPGSGGKPSASIPLKAGFVPVDDGVGNRLEMIRNGGALAGNQDAFWQMGEGTQDVHVRILDPANYGPLQIYIPKRSGFYVDVFFAWPPAAWQNPNLAKCGWPNFLRSYSVANEGTDVLSASTFSFQTSMMLIETTDEDGRSILQNTGGYLNLSKMGINGYPSIAMAQSTILRTSLLGTVLFDGMSYSRKEGTSC